MERVPGDTEMVWADEEIDLLLNIFSSETIQSFLEAARSPRDKNAIYHEVNFFKVASATSRMQIETNALETPNRLARDRISVS